MPSTTITPLPGKGSFPALCSGTEPQRSGLSIAGREPSSGLGWGNQGTAGQASTESVSLARCHRCKACQALTCQCDHFCVSAEQQSRGELARSVCEELSGPGAQPAWILQGRARSCVRAFLHRRI